MVFNTFFYYEACLLDLRWEEDTRILFPPPWSDEIEIKFRLVRRLDVTFPWLLVIYFRRRGSRAYYLLAFLKVSVHLREYPCPRGRKGFFWGGRGWMFLMIIIIITSNQISITMHAYICTIKKFTDFIICLKTVSIILYNFPSNFNSLFVYFIPMF